MSPPRSTCPYDCPDACGLLVSTEAGRVTAVRGDPDHGFTQGALCPKVNGYEKTVHAPGRLLTPLVRTGPKGTASFREASWDEAVALIAARWRALIAEHGPQCVLPVSYAGTMGLIQRNALHPLFHRMGASLLERAICTPAQDVAWKQVMGATAGPDPEAAARSDLIILWGCNALATNVHFLRQLKAAQRAGGRVFLVDTYRQPTAPLVDRVFLVRPGTDGALALGVLNVLVRRGLVDRDFLAQHTQGWADLERQVLADAMPDRVSALTGVSVGDLEALAEAYGRARAPFIRMGGGLSRYGNGAMTARALLCLPAAVGAWAKDGGGLLMSTGTAAAFDLKGFTREDLLPAGPPPRVVNLNRLGHGLTRLEPKVRSIYVSHCNPAAVCPDQNAVLEGLSRDDLFTVVHERFMTDTARYADVVLPAPTMLETEDLYRGVGHFYVQHARPVIAPVGQSRSNWDTVRALAAAMGYQDDVFTRTAGEHIAALLAVPSPWFEGLDRVALAEGRAVRLRPPPGFRTPTGRILLRNDALPEPVPTYRPPHSDGDRLPLQLQTAPSLHRLNSSFAERGDLTQKLGAQTLQLSAADATARGLTDGQRVLAWNELGTVPFRLVVSDGVPPGVAVAEGVHWLDEAHPRTVNALVSQRLTDGGNGSTFYDNRIDVRAA